MDDFLVPDRPPTPGTEGDRLAETPGPGGDTGRGRNRDTFLARPTIPRKVKTEITRLKEETDQNHTLFLVDRLG